MVPNTIADGAGKAVKSSVVHRVRSSFATNALSPISPICMSRRSRRLMTGNASSAIKKSSSHIALRTGLYEIS